MHAAIPTTYKGINFRSRLEARWAAFFDLLGWRWEYEPEDLNGWIPDFVLFDQCGQREVLVEVKPIRELGEESRAAMAKYAASGDDRFCLFLGLGPVNLLDRVCAGWLAEDLVPCREYVVEILKVSFDPTIYAASHAPEPAPFVGVCQPAGGIKLTNRFDFDVWTAMFAEDGATIAKPFAYQIERLWTAAGNLTQWKAPRHE